jgi:ribose transport system permease protein
MPQRSAPIEGTAGKWVNVVLRRLRSIDRVTIGAFGLAALLFLIASIHSPAFADWSNIRQMLVFASFTGFAALGEAIIILAGGIDLSIPWLMAFGGIELEQLHVSAVMAIVLVVGMGLGIGALNGVFVTVLGVPPLIATLGMGGLVEGYLTAVGTLQSAGDTVPPSVLSFASSGLFGVPVVALIWLAAAIVAAIVLTRTSLGRRIYAVGSNPRAARLAGVHVARVRFITYVIGGGTATFAGILLSGYIETAYPGMGANYLFGAIAAVALGGAELLGGKGTYWGAVAGALTLTVLTSLLPVFGLSAGSLQIGYGLVILVGVYMARNVDKIGRLRVGQRDR